MTGRWSKAYNFVITLDKIWTLTQKNGKIVIYGY